MIPFVRYVLGKALKYNLDVHILLECIKNSTESELLQLLFARFLFVVWRSLAPPAKS